MSKSNAAKPKRGRPPGKSAKGVMPRLQIRVPLSMRGRIATMGKQRGLTLSQMTRRLLEKGIESEVSK